jgi:PAS domain S-box-containing protein
MNNMEFQLRGVGDPRLAVHATSPQPAWLWSIDGTRILWANPVGASLFGADNAAELAQRILGPADSHRRQVAQLAGRLPPSGAIRLERLRGFGAPLGRLVTCGCARLDFADGNHGILITVAEPVGRTMPLLERLQRLVDDIDMPIASFSRDGRFVGASRAARPLLGFRDLSEAGLDQARNDALKQGRVETPIGIGHLVLQRVGSGADVGLVALIVPGDVTHPKPVAAEPAAPVEPEPPAISNETGIELVDEFAAPLSEAAETATAVEYVAPAEAATPPTPDYEQPVLSGEAPAEFALIDTPPPSSAEPEIEHTPVEHASAEPPASPQEPAPREFLPHEPSPYVEALADEPRSIDIAAPAEPTIETAATEPTIETTTAAPPPARAPSWLDEPAPNTRRHPLRFMWQMDAEGHFSIGSDEFTKLIGHQTAAGFGRLWSEIAATFGLDPDGRVLRAVATHDTWSGITLNWPVDGGGRLPVELSGLPMFDRARQFAGYRGFGVCRDLDGLARLAALRRYEVFSPAPQPLSAQAGSTDLTKEAPAEASAASPSTLVSSIASETSHPTDLETPVETPKNVLPFRPLGEPKSPALTPVENNAFNELARQLAERLDRDGTTTPSPEAPSSEAPLPETLLADTSSSETSPAETSLSETTPSEIPLSETLEAVVDQPAVAETPALVSEQPTWLAQPERPARGDARRDKTLLDLLPVGVLIYRLDRLLYANRAFLERMGYQSLHALEEAGGLDALYVEPGVSNASSTSETGTPVTISATQASPEHAPQSTTEAHLYTITWDEESALALIFSPAQAASAPAAIAEPDHILESSSAEPAAIEPSAVGHANAEELGAILDTTAEGIVMFDAEGHIHACNRSTEALFGQDGSELVQRNLTELFAPESQPAVRDYLESVKGADIASLLDHGRDVLAQVGGGGLIPVSVTMGRTQAHGPNFFAVFRDLSQARKSESELREARRLVDRAANAKSDMLARISHEVRTPLNAIIGFAEVMIGERFGTLGNERYVEYMKDIRASGERVIAIVNDLHDLSRIETGKLDLAFANQNLNDLVEQCVAVMQPQANRERIIIRTSLAHTLPPVVADARALRQITLNLIGNSIHLANAGGQVIVSTALSDFGDVVLRVRDTGHGLNDNEVAAAMEPFRTTAPSDQASDSSAVSLSLTKALVEANRAQFQIKTGPHPGTLIEVVFSQAMARA